MVTPPPLDLVTGAFSYSGSHIARRLLDAGHRVRTLSFHPDRRHPLQDSVEALAYQFDDPDELARSLEGVATLYNTYWVRFDHGQTSFEQAIERSRSLFAAAYRGQSEPNTCCTGFRSPPDCAQAGPDRRTDTREPRRCPATDDGGQDGSSASSPDARRRVTGERYASPSS